MTEVTMPAVATGAGRPPGRTWRVYDVTVQGFGTAPVAAASRGGALASAWRSDAFSHLTFKDFLRKARAGVRAEPPGPGRVRPRPGQVRPGHPHRNARAP